MEENPISLNLGDDSMAVTFRDFLHGVSQSIPQIMQLYVYSLDYKMKKEDQVFEQDLATKKNLREERSTESQINRDDAINDYYDAQTTTEGYLQDGYQRKAKNETAQFDLIAEGERKLTDLMNATRSNDKNGIKSITRDLKQINSNLSALRGTGFLIKESELKNMTTTEAINLTMLLAHATTEDKDIAMQLMNESGNDVVALISKVLANPNLSDELRGAVRNAQGIFTDMEQMLNEDIAEAIKDVERPRSIQIVAKKDKNGEDIIDEKTGQPQITTIGVDPEARDLIQKEYWSTTDIRKLELMRTKYPFIAHGTPLFEQFVLHKMSPIYQQQYMNEKQQRELSGVYKSPEDLPGGAGGRGTTFEQGAPTGGGFWDKTKRTLENPPGAWDLYGGTRE